MNDTEYKSTADKAYKLHTDGKINEAIELYVQLLKENEKDADILFLYGQASFAVKEYDEAMAAFLEVYEITKSDAVKIDIARVLYQTGKYNDAVSVLLGINDKDKQTIQLLASCYRKCDNYSEAVKYYEALGENKEGYDYYNLAYCLSNTGEHEKAIHIYEEYIKKYSPTAEIYVLMGLNAADMNEFELSVKYYDKALELNPNDINARQSKAASLDYLKKYDETIQTYNELIMEGNSDPQTLSSLGLSFLRRKQFDKGYELFLNKRMLTSFKDEFKDKIWNKETEINGKNVLLYSDCGLGDTIMYLRFLNTLKERCKKVTLKTNKCLLKLLSDNFSGIEFRAKSDETPEYDIASSIMDIQYMLDIDFNNIGEAKPYLKADKSLAEKFGHEIFSSEKRPKIGVCRKGNTTGLKNRFIDYSLIKDLTSDGKFKFYNFQPDTDDAETDNYMSLKKYINDFNDTAALLMNIDLLITVDTAIAHMAGALGVKTFLMLPYSADWRWFDDTDKTLWYDSVKIFKQKELGDWQGVIEEIKAELNKYAS